MKIRGIDDCNRIYDFIGEEMISKEERQRLRELADRAIGHESLYPLNEVYSYRPCGYHEKDFAVSWNGRHRFVERVPEDFASTIVDVLKLAIASRTAIPDYEAALTEMENRIAYLEQHELKIAINEVVEKISAMTPEEFRAEVIDKPLGDIGEILAKSGMFASYDEKDEYIKKLEVRIEMIREALEEATAGLSTALDDMYHCFEESCVPTKSEVISCESYFRAANRSLHCNCKEDHSRENKK